jgi:hypothetical protein
MIKVGDEVIAIKDSIGGRYVEWDRFTVRKVERLSKNDTRLKFVGDSMTLAMSCNFKPVYRVSSA